MLRILLGALIGGIIGFGIGHFGKCVTGTCPLTGNPVVSAILGIVIGVLVAMRV